MKKNFLFILFLSFFVFKAQTWTSIGPNGGYFKDFTFHPTNSQIIFAGSDDSGGIWKSMDGGQTWTLTTSAIPNFTGWKVVIDKTDPNIVYGCDLYGRYGMIKSTNGGNSWQVINSGLSSRYDKMVTGIAIANGTPDTLLISTGYEETGTPPRPGNGIFKSFNAGLTWSPAGLQGTTTPCIASNGAAGAIFAGTRGKGLMITTNLGTTWVNHPQIPNTYDIAEIKTDSNIVMVSASSNGIYLSTDYGNNFTNIGMLSEFNFDITIFRKVPTIELFSSTFSGLKRYSSSTNSWTAVNHSELNNHLTMGIASKSNTLFCSNFTNGLILRSTDGGINWSSIIASPKATEIGGLYVDPTNSNHMVASLLGTYNIGNLPGKEAVAETMDGGVTWIRKGPVAHGRGVTKDNNSAGTFYLGTFAKGLYKTVDAFATFTNVRSGNKVIYDVAVDPFNSQNILISELDIPTTSHSVLKSNDGGLSFTSTSTLVVTKLAYDATTPSVVYASSFSGLFKSIDGGATWSNFVLGPTPLSTVSQFNTNIYAAHLNGALYKITGTSSVNITGPWPNNSQINNILEYNGKIIVGINGAEKDTTLNMMGQTYLSHNGGTSWINISGNMPCTHVYGMNALQAVGNDLYVGTYGGGVYKLSNILMNLTNTIEDSKSLYGFPNPANEIINFNSLIEISVYDIAGDIKYNGTTNQINVSDWPNGIYFAKNSKSSFKFIVAH